MDSGKRGCALDMVYEVVRSNEKTAPRDITVVVYLDSPQWITLNLMASFLIRTVDHDTERPLLKLLMHSHNLQDPLATLTVLVKLDQ